MTAQLVTITVSSDRTGDPHFGNQLGLFTTCQSKDLHAFLAGLVPHA